MAWHCWTLLFKLSAYVVDWLWGRCPYAGFLQSAVDRPQHAPNTHYFSPQPINCCIDPSRLHCEVIELHRESGEPAHKLYNGERVRHG